jgi:YYY domain-containing protein
MLNAVTAADSAPPEDPWLAGEPVAYYYGGYWMFGGVAMLSSVPEATAFNLSNALIAGMSASGIFSLVYSLSRSSAAPFRKAALAGVTSAVLLLIIASLAGWWELAANFGVGSDGFYDWLAIDGLRPNHDTSNWRPDQFWWWFRASRVINTFSDSGAGLDYTIEEFPFFSMMLADLHPHVMSIPFLIAGLTAAYNLLLSETRWGFGWIKQHPLSAAATALIIGASGFINQADVLLLSAVFGGAVILKSFREGNGNLPLTALTALMPLAALAGAGVALFSPFYFVTLDGQIQSPPIAPVEFGTRPVHFLTVWGVFLLICTPFLAYVATGVLGPYAGAMRARMRAAAAASQGGLVVPQLHSEPVPATPEAPPEPSPAPRLPRAVWVTPLVLTVVPYLGWAVTHIAYNEFAEGAHIFTRLGTALPLGAVFFALFVTTVMRARSGANDATQFVLLLATLSVFMLFGVELLFIHDLFGNRMNTVFKLYYQVWIMLSVVGAYCLFQWRGLHYALKGRALLASRTAAIALAVLLVGPLWYPAAAAVTKADEYSGAVTLDGWAYLETFEPEDAEAIVWLRQEAGQGSRIVEAVGGSYTSYGRISAATGLPTILGWPGHERQWRGPGGPHEGREDDVRQIYEIADAEQARRLLEFYEVSYVIVGARERASYPGLNSGKFDSLGEKVFESQGLAIYRVGGLQG